MFLLRPLLTYGNRMVTEPGRPRGLSRSRGLVFAVIMIVTILVAQMGTSIVGAIVAQRQAQIAAQDTFSYVGDLTVERVSRYAEAGTDTVAETASAIVNSPGDVTLDEVATMVYLRLDRKPQVRGAYVGFPDGSFVSVSREGTGFTAQRVEVSPERNATESAYDAQFKEISRKDIDLDYDPRVRPWYLAGEGSLKPVWTDPYLLFDSNVTFASAAAGARTRDGLVAVVGADVSLEQLVMVLDSLPLGAGAQGFVLSGDRRVIAAPSEFTQTLRETATLTGAVPLASDIELGSEAVASDHSDGDVFGRSGDRIIVERSFPKAEGLDWVLHLEADESQLSLGLDSLQLTIYLVTAISTLMVVAAGVLVYRMWRPLRGLDTRAATDQLTGLANRHEYQRRGRALLHRAEVRHATVAVMVMDMDHFKTLNDTLGHEAGDEALKAVGAALQANARTRDVVARLGGDEFVLLQVLPHVDHVASTVERVRADVEKAVRTGTRGDDLLGITAGYSVSRAGMYDLEVLVHEADVALLAGKRAVRGRSYRHRPQPKGPLGTYDPEV